MQKITPFLWFDTQAEEAVALYTSLFGNSKILRTARYGEAGPGPKGSVMSLTFRLEGQEFMALNGGPYFSFTPATSFFVSCTTENEVDALWRGLSEGGTVLMDLASYPFSKKFGWVADRFGLSWQLHLAGRDKRITPFLMFVGGQHGKAEEAMRRYVSLFKNSRVDQIERFGAAENGAEGTVKHGRFLLNGQEFMAMDSNQKHDFPFTPAMSFFVDCATQEEIDEFWEGLSEGGKTGQCGWLEDRYGVSWQIVPTVLGELLEDDDAGRSKRVMEAMLRMTKLDIKELQRSGE